MGSISLRTARGRQSERLAARVAAEAAATSHEQGCASAVVIAGGRENCPRAFVKDVRLSLNPHRWIQAKGRLIAVDSQWTEET